MRSTSSAPRRSSPIRIPTSSSCGSSVRSARESHHDVVMVTGYEEAVSVFHDTATFSSCNSVTGPFPGLSRAAGRRRRPRPHRAITTTSCRFSDQLLRLDPPIHTAHRALLMRVDHAEAAARERGRSCGSRRPSHRRVLAQAVGASSWVSMPAPSPFSWSPICWACPESDFGMFIRAPARKPATRREHRYGDRPTVRWSTCPPASSSYVEDRRRNPCDDVLTSLATTTFPDGSPVHEASHCASPPTSSPPGRRPRCGSWPHTSDARRAPGSPGRSSVLIALASRTSSRRCCASRSQSRAPSACHACDVGRGRRSPGRYDRDGAQRRANRDPRHFESPTEFRSNRANARQHLAFGHGAHTCPGAPLARAEGYVSVERLLERVRGITISETEHGPAGARRYDYAPTYILRGLKHLHLEFTPTGSQ